MQFFKLINWYSIFILMYEFIKLVSPFRHVNEMFLLATYWN